MLYPCLLVLAVAPAPAPSPLQWKFRAGEVFYVHRSDLTKQKLSVMGQDIQMTQTATMVYKFDVKKVHGNGAVDLEMTFHDFKMTLEPGGPIEQFAKLKGATVEFALDGKGNVSRLENYAKFLDKVAGGDPNQKAMMEMVSSEDAIRESFRELFLFSPPKAVQRGDTWKQNTRMVLGTVVAMERATTYTFEGVAGPGDGLTKLTRRSTLQYTPPGKNVVEGQPFRIVDADLKGEETKGVVLFDPKLGRTTEGSNVTRLKGTMKIDIGGNEVEIALETETKSTTRVLDKEPKAE